MIERKYEDGTITDRAEYFTGIEVEKLPSYGKKTLFVVCWKEAKEIIDIAKEQKITNIYLGANKFLYNWKPNFRYPWNDTIQELLSENYTVTLDASINEYEFILKEVLKQETLSHRNFTLNLGIEMPNVKSLNHNTTIKIDDKHPNFSNDGIYCYPLKDILNDHNKTNWNEYDSDKMVK